MKLFLISGNTFTLFAPKRAGGGYFYPFRLSAFTAAAKSVFLLSVFTSYIIVNKLILRTEFSAPVLPVKLSSGAPVVFSGSCFSDHMAARLARIKYPVPPGEFGTLFSPAAIHFSLSDAPFSPQRVVERDGFFYHLDVHSSFYDSDKANLLRRLEEGKYRMNRDLAGAAALFITWGTAWVYEPAEGGMPVANCHKLPAARFSKKLLSTEEVIRDFTAFHAELRSRFPELPVVLTVSPVRHVKDGVPEDRLSKSILRVAADAACRLPGVHYFPAYEWITDDLRDYRFYKDDLVHPTDFAVEYVWEKFSETFFDEDTRQFNKKIERWMAGFHHRTLAGGAAHAAFLQRQLDAGAQLHGPVDLSAELDELRLRLSQI